MKKVNIGVSELSLAEARKVNGGSLIALGIAALAVSPLGLMFWTIGFCILHLIWGIWFKIWFDRKQ